MAGCALPFTVLRANPSEGYSRIGDAIAPAECGPLDPPSSCETALPAIIFKNGPWLAAPESFRMITPLGGDAGAPTLYVWRPLAPAGFRCLGDIVSPNSTEPSADEGLIMCVSEGLLVAMEVRREADLSTVAVDEVVDEGDSLWIWNATEVWESVSCSAAETGGYCVSAGCSALYVGLHNTFRGVGGGWDPSDESMRQWSFASGDLSGEIATSFSTVPVYGWESSSSRFRQLSRQGVPVEIATVGASGVDIFTINPPEVRIPGAAGMALSARYFIAVANRQSEGPEPPKSHVRNYDTESELFEFIRLDIGGVVEYTLVRQFPNTRTFIHSYIHIYAYIHT